MNCFPLLVSKPKKSILPPLPCVQWAVVRLWNLAVKWVYSADKTINIPYNDNLQSLIHEPTFRFAVDHNTWGKLPFIIKLGNLAVHTERSVQKSDALASLLERKATIPQIKAKLAVLHEIHTDAFWDANDILLFEKIRKELRELIRFLDEGNRGQKHIITKLTDPILEQQEGVQLDAAYDFEDYRAKVNRYVNEHGNTLAIHKLNHNIPLSMKDYQELERVLTNELGTKEDYVREFGDTPFGLLIRKIAKLNHEAAMQAFSSFINDQSLNQKQISFVNKIINHIELNGYMENVAELTKPPFDKPMNFVKLFDTKIRTALIETINQVRENAVEISAS